MLNLSLETLDRILQFRRDRDWEQFHSPRTLAVSVAIEAAELIEIFQWVGDSDLSKVAHEQRSRIEEEIADVAIYMALLANDLNIDLDSAVRRKLDLNEMKYPVERFKGASTKYTDL